MKDGKGSTTQAMMFLKANGVAFTDHLYGIDPKELRRVLAVEEGEDAAVGWPLIGRSSHRSVRA